MTIHNLNADIEALKRQRDRLRQDIAGQQRLLEQLRGRVVAARRDRLTELEANFDEQLAGLEQYSPYLVEKHANLIARLRDRLPERAESGEDLRAIVKRAAAGR